MLSLSLQNTKDFMSKLLKNDTFDNFELHNLTIHSVACFEVTKMPSVPSPTWATIRPLAFEVIKGNKAPNHMKIVLAQTSEDIVRFLNITFDGEKITITSGLSQKNFSLDKSEHRQWNEHILDFLGNNAISYTNDLL